MAGVVMDARIFKDVSSAPARDQYKLYSRSPKIPRGFILI